MPRRRTLLLAAFALALGLSAPVPARAGVVRRVTTLPPEKPKPNPAGRFDGFYLGLGWRGNRIGQGFDGQSALVGRDIVVLLPKMADGIGFEALGVVKSTVGGMSFGYSRIVHDATWLGARGTAVFNTVDFDLRAYPLPRLPLQPYVLGGGGFKWLVVKDAAVRGATVGDARFTDFGWNYGGGVLLFPAPRWAIDIGVAQGSISYTAVTPVKGDWVQIREETHASGLNARAALLFAISTLDR